ncbi:MAG: hypothetical protein H0W27_00985 [Actinobacteria bacterium]|nr:hypothetical protein [Actinomycetota bacterium]
MREDPLVLRGTAVQALPRRNRTWGEGRSCEKEGCATRLSMYNREKFCWAHAPVKYYSPRGRRNHPEAA